MMTVLLAGDLSQTNSGFAYDRPDGSIGFMSFQAPPGDLANCGRTFLIFENKLCDLFEAVSPGFFAFEAPLPPKAQRSHYTGYLLIGLAAIAEKVSAGYEVPSKKYNNGEWKRSFTGHGNCTKEMTFRTCALIGWAPKNYDEADAGGIYAYHRGCTDPKWNPKNLPLLGRSVA